MRQIYRFLTKYYEKYYISNFWRKNAIVVFKIPHLAILLAVCEIKGCSNIRAGRTKPKTKVFLTCGYEGEDQK